MSNPSVSDLDKTQSQSGSPAASDNNESFGDVLSQFERSHVHTQKKDGGKGLEGTVIALSADSVYLDIGNKTEGILPIAE